MIVCGWIGRRREVYFGGGLNGLALPTNATAFWDGQNWTLLPTNPPLPSPRLFPAMTYDSARHATEGVKKCQDTVNAAKPTHVFLRIMKILCDIL